jgi:hypothetical protein
MTSTIGFLIDATGAWLTRPSPEADWCISQTGPQATLESAMDSDGFVAIAFSHELVSVQLNPAAVTGMALASLRPRLAGLPLPIALTLRDPRPTTERHAYGAAAMDRIDAAAGQYQIAARQSLLGTPSEPAPASHGSAHGGSAPLGIGDHVVAEDGSWHLAEDPLLLARIGFSDPKIDAVGYAVRNMGFLRVFLPASGELAIAVHPRAAAPAAVIAVAERLAGVEDRSVRVLRLEDRWVSQLHEDGTAAARALCELCGVSFAVPANDRWYLTPAKSADLSEDSADPLLLMQRKWRITFGRFSDSVLPFAIRHGLIDRLIIAARRRDDDLVFRFIGDGLATLFPDEFRFNAIGNDIADQPDKEYGAWVAQAYRDVAGSGVPRLEHIDAYLPGSARGPWIRYQRLLLPWRTPGGVLVTMSSRITMERLLRRPT